METNENLTKEEKKKGKNGLGMAVGSMICGAFGFLLFFNIFLAPILAIGALILGIIAKNEMRRLSKPKGKLFATFGIVLGILVLVMVALQLMAYVMHFEQ